MHPTGPTTNTSSTTAKQYNLVEQLQKTPAQISILELLKLSPTHKEILERALVDNTISKHLDINQFQTMVGHFTTPHCLSFTKEYDMSLQHPHNAPLHIEVLIHKM